MDLTDDQWNLLRPLIPPHKSGPGKSGRPVKDDRAILNGILWILKTGARWQDLPARYPPYQTVHRRFQNWNQAGMMRTLLRELVRDLKERGGIDLSECFIDGTFNPAKKGALELERQSGARAAKSWRLQTVLVFLSPYAQRALRPMK
jgi:transposase